MVSIATLVMTVSAAWSVGLFVGLFTAKFVSKKECDVHRQEVWKNIDGIKNVMAGGRMRFELRQIPCDNDN